MTPNRSPLRALLPMVVLLALCQQAAAQASGETLDVIAGPPRAAPPPTAPRPETSRTPPRATPAPTGSRFGANRRPGRVEIRVDSTIGGVVFRRR